MKKNSVDFSSFLSIAVQAAQKAGRILVKNYGQLRPSQIKTKAENDFVTIIDKQCEETIISTIHKSFPHHQILAEESGRGFKNDSRQPIWIIDPLDGTSNYIHQIPMFCVSIGVLFQNDLKVAVVADPIHAELYTAIRGQGAFLNKKRIHVTSTQLLSGAFIATGIPFRAKSRFDEYIVSFEKISTGSVNIRRCGSAALDLAYVAAGKFDGFWEIDLSPWDIAAGALLVEEAGGRITDMWGGNDYLKTGDILGANPHIHSQLVAITSRTFTPLKNEKLGL